MSVSFTPHSRQTFGFCPNIGLYSEVGKPIRSALACFFLSADLHRANNVPLSFDNLSECNLKGFPFVQNEQASRVSLIVRSYARFLE
jgi:hypothetical protein